MVINKIKEMLSGNDEKYEVLYYKYSKIKLENVRLKQEHEKQMRDYKGKQQMRVAKDLIEIYQDIEETKNESFKVKTTDKETQRLLISLNKLDKNMKDIMKDYAIESYSAAERFYDPEQHDVASYQDAKGIQKGIIIKTVKKGFKYKNDIIQKPKVLVTK